MKETLDPNGRMPRCIRKYDRNDPECNGRERARTEHERMPCLFRDRCLALQRLMKRHNYAARDILRHRKFRDQDGKRRVYAFPKMDPEKFKLWLIRGVDRYGIRDGRATIVRIDEQSPIRKSRHWSPEARRLKALQLVKAREKAVLSLREKTAQDLEASLQLLQWFLVRLQKLLKREFRLTVGQAEAGELFIADRLKASRYLTIYVKTADRRTKTSSRRPIVCCILAPRERALQLFLPIAPDSFLKCLDERHRNRCPVAPIIRGRFRARTRPLGKEGVSLVAEALTTAVKRGVLSLPDPPEVAT